VDFAVSVQTGRQFHGVSAVRFGRRFERVYRGDVELHPVEHGARRAATGNVAVPRRAQRRMRRVAAAVYFRCAVGAGVRAHLRRLQRDAAGRVLVPAGAGRPLGGRRRRRRRADGGIRTNVARDETHFRFATVDAALRAVARSAAGA